MTAFYAGLAAVLFAAYLLARSIRRRGWHNTVDRILGVHDDTRLWKQFDEALARAAAKQRHPSGQALKEKR